MVNYQQYFGGWGAGASSNLPYSSGVSSPSSSSNIPDRGRGSGYDPKHNNNHQVQDITPASVHHNTQVNTNIQQERDNAAKVAQISLDKKNKERIKAMQDALALQESLSIAERIKQEKTDVYDPNWAGDRRIKKEREKRYTPHESSNDLDLLENLRAKGVTSPDDPSLTSEEKEALKRLQFAQDEGVYGGVSGYEAEVNKLKKQISEGGAGYDEALKSLAYLSGTRGEATPAGIGGGMVPGAVTPNEELAKISALGVQEYLKRKTKGDPKALTDILTGKTKIEGLSPEFFKNLVGQTGTLEPRKDKYGAYIKGDALGYDPTGQFSFRDIEETAGRFTERDEHGMLIAGGWVPNEDPNSLYNKYLNRGTLWDDPLSGILKAPGEPPQEGGQDYGYGYNYRGSQRDRNLALLQFLQGGSPIKQLEKSGFMGSMESAYQDAPETLEKGLFSKIIPGGAFNPEAMKRLVTSWGSGYTNPRYANVAARGGIMSAWNNRR